MLYLFVVLKSTKKGGAMEKYVVGSGVLLTIICAAFISADTLTLQQGLNGFTGFRDTYIVMSTDSTPDVSDQLVVEGYHCSACIDERAIIQVDLSGIAPNKVIAKAELQLFSPSQPRRGAGTVRAYKVKKPWVTAEANWFKASNSVSWDKSGGDYGETAVGSLNYGTQINVWHTLDITSAVRDFVADPSSNNGLMLMLDPAMLTVTYVSSEGRQDQRPKLIITFSQSPVLNPMPVKSSLGFSIKAAAAGIKFGFPKQDQYRVAIEKINGSSVLTEWVYGGSYSLGIHGMAEGLYLATVTGKQGRFVKEIAITHHE
jgi:hypothetical protein